MIFDTYLRSGLVYRVVRNRVFCENTLLQPAETGKNPVSLLLTGS
ncbi:MAG: hypothetical protein U7126_30110 [Microcoleus sp.]